jgi:hypothetical protein
LLLGEVCGLLN